MSDAFCPLRTVRTVLDCTHQRRTRETEDRAMREAWDKEHPDPFAIFGM